MTEHASKIEFSSVANTFTNNHVHQNMFMLTFFPDYGYDWVISKACIWTDPCSN